MVVYVYFDVPHNREMIDLIHAVRFRVHPNGPRFGERCSREAATSIRVKRVTHLTARISGRNHRSNIIQNDGNAESRGPIRSVHRTRERPANTQEYDRTRSRLKRGKYPKIPLTTQQVALETFVHFAQPPAPPSTQSSFVPKSYTEILHFLLL